MKISDYLDITLTVDNHLEFDSRAWRLAKFECGRHGSFFIDFDRYPLTDDSITLAKQAFYTKLKEINYSPHNPVTSSSITFCRNLILALCILREFYPGRKLSSLQKSEILDLYGLCMLYGLNTKNQPSGKLSLTRLPKPKTKNKIEALITLNRWLHKTYQAGLTCDGPDFDITRSTIIKHLAQTLSQSEIDVTSWHKDGSYGSIPFVVANLLLVDAIEIINSEKCKQVLAYFDLCRVVGLAADPKILWANYCCRLRKFRHTTDERFLFEQTNAEQKGTSECVERLAIPLHQALIEISGNDYKFPWPTYQHFVADHNKILTASYVIFLSLLGKRGPSEVLTLRGCDLTLPTSTDQATIRAANYKSFDGARINQGITSFIRDAYDTLARCSYIHKEGTELPIFSTLPTLSDIYKPQMSISHAYSYELLHLYYDSFIERASHKVDFCIKTLHPHIGTHQFRHTFAEYALRRFDGNVEEMLRQIFQHGTNQWWIKRYTADKLDHEVMQRLNHEYVQELIPRVLRDLDSAEQDFVGGMAIYLKANIAPKTHNLTPQEFEKLVTDLSCHFTLTPHEYGWCMLLAEYSNQARCTIDGVNPFPEGTDCEKCNKCMHFLSSKSSHFATQKLIAISHIDFIECNFWASPSLREASLQAIRSAQRLFPELLDFGEF